MKAIFRLIAFLILVSAAPSFAQDAVPAQKEFEPPAGKGRVAIVLSGQSGPDNYAYFAKDLAQQGYYAVLLDGNDFWAKKNGSELLKGVITRAQQSPNALPGKAAVVGFSMGGGVSLVYATKMPDLVSAVVTYYPATTFITDQAGFVSKIQVPTLLFAGGRDTYKNCCLIETARKLSETAKASDGKAPLEVVEYPDAEHGWNIKTSKQWRTRDAADGFERTLKHLKQY